MGSAVIAAGGFAAFAAAGGSLFAAFALGAGLSLVSRALMPKADVGAQMGGQSVMTREAATSRKIVYGRARIGGNVVYLESTGSDNKYLYLVMAVAGHEIDAYEEVWFNDEKVWDGGVYQSGWATAGNSSTSPYVDIQFYKGDQTAADSGLVSASNKWTTDHKLLDTAYMVVRLTHDVDKFAQGLPNISTIIRGKKVLNPNGGAVAWSQNPALCIYDYLRDTKYGLGEEVANILTSSVNTAKTVCDGNVPLSAGGNQPRYTINGVVDTATSIKTNIETMVGSMAGRLVYSGGKFEIHAGEYVAPAYTVDESQIIGEITVQTKQSRRSAFNGVKGIFLSEEDNYILADYPAQISSTFAAQDGDPIYLDMPLPFTTNNIRAQRLAKLALFRSRQQEAITIPCNLSALRFKIGDNINVTNTRLGYNQKIFEVVGYAMDFRSDGQIVVNVNAIETAASIWDWQASDQEVFLGAGEVALYTGTTAIAPQNIQVASDSFLSLDGTFNSQFIVTWTNANDAFTDHYVVEWKLASDDNYFSQTTKSTPFHIVNLVNLQSYNVRVKAVNELGVSSAYLEATVTSAKDTVAPAVPTQVTAAGGFEQITISWVNPTADDFKGVQVYRSNTQNGTYAYLDDADGTSFVDTPILLVNGAVVTRHYKLKSFDFSGNILTTPNNGFSGRASATTTLVPVGGIGNDAVTTSTIADQAVTTDTIDDDAVTIAKIATSLQSTNYSSGSAGWKILKSGVVEFEQATIRGNISATTGSIGGYTINSNSLFAGSGNTRVSLSTADGISLGSNTFNDAPFSVTRAGALKATSATITGALTLTNVDGATVVYTSGNLQVGTVQTANIANDAINNAKIAINAIQGDVIAAGAIVSAKLGVDAVTSAKIADNAVVTAAINDNAITNALIATDAVNSDSLVANAVTAVKIVSGAITTAKIEAGAVVANSIAANAIIADKIAADAITANKIAANAITADAIAANAVTANAIAANSIVASKIAADAVTANKINVTNLAAINANMGTITAGSISVGLLTGDVTESYPLMLYPNLALTNSVQTVSSFSLPAPSLGISKRQKLAFNTKITIRNTNNSAVGTYAIRMDVQKKSKGVNAVSVGTVTIVSFASFVGVLYVSGNKLGVVDGAGGIADSASPSNVSNVQGVYYDQATNRTYITYSDQFNRFSNGETAYYSDSKFTSAGTWVTPSSGIAYQIRTPSGTNTFEDVNIPIDLFFGSSTTATDFRVRMFVVQNLSGFTFLLSYMRGFMENTA